MFVVNINPPGIFVAPVDTLNFTLVPGFGDHEAISHPVAIDFDPVDNMLYWTDARLGVINRALQDGSGSVVTLLRDLRGKWNFLDDMICQLYL